jgi:hypothetical protein
MAELLVKVADNTHPDTSINTEACFKASDIVFIAEDGHNWGALEGLPNFIVVKVPGLALAAIQDRRDAWVRSIGYEVVNQDAVQDGVRVRVFTEVPGGANQYGLTRAQVESWLNNWGASVVDATTNEVRFDITVQAAYMSAGFWGTDPATFNIFLTETNYDQVSGVHTVAVDLSSSTISPQNVEDHIKQAGATIVSYSPSTKVAVIEFTRTQMRQYFINALKESLRKEVRTRRYSVSAATVAAAIAAGGVITMTTAELTADVLDKAA